MTQIESYPFVVQGKHTIKSMEISSHFQTGIVKGSRNPGVRIWSALTLPQMSISGWARIGAEVRNFFRAWKASSQAELHTNLTSF